MKRIFDLTIVQLTMFDPDKATISILSHHAGLVLSLEYVIIALSLQFCGQLVNLQARYSFPS